jgi:hypothetical protein
MRLDIRVPALWALVIIVGLSGAVQAHHSIPAYYNVNATVSITGILKQVKIMNPHSAFLVEVTEANGQKSTWLATAGSGVQMSRAGWTNDTIKVGTTVTVEGNPAKAPGVKGMIVNTFILPDGRRVSPGEVD